MTWFCAIKMELQEKKKKKNNQLKEWFEITSSFKLDTFP